MAAAGRGGGAPRALTLAPATSGGPSAEPTPRPALGLAALLLALGALSALKGLNTFVDPTASYFYYADYRFGLVARGLVGQLFAPALDALPAGAHPGLLVAWHVAGLAALLAALARLAARTVAAAAGRADVLAAAVLLFCSPLVPSLAYFTAAPDTLLCLLTLAVVAAARAGRQALACAVLLAGTLAHQLMVFLALPLLVLASLVHARWPVPAVAWALAAGLAACVIVLAAPAPDARLVGRLVAHGVPLEDARGLVQLQLGQGALEMLGVMAGMWRANPLNGAIALAHGAAAGVAILAVCFLTPGALRRVAERLPPAVPDGPRGLLAGLLVTSAALGPLMVLAFAWDLTRLAVLSAFTAFLTADLLLRRGGPSVGTPDPTRSSKLAALACGTLAAAFLCLPFVALWFGGLYQNDFDPVVRDPLRDLAPIRSAFERFLAFYNRHGP